MPVPKHRTSASKRDKRRSHHALKASSLSTCPNCKEVRMPHRACPSCGQYKGQQALEARNFGGIDAANSIDSSSSES